MVITPKNLSKHELIGLKIEVVQSTDPSQVGLTGHVIGETRNTIIIRTLNEKEKTVQKQGSTFNISLSEGEVEVDGDKLVQGPAERSKIMVKKW